jgi:predicted PurR-regulated permease PerM
MKILNKKLINYAILALVISVVVFSTFFVIRDMGTILGSVFSFIKKFLRAITPLIIGIILAYLFDGPVNFFEKLFGKMKGRRVLAIALLYILILGFIAAVIYLVVPGIVKSLTSLINEDIPAYSIVIYNKLQEGMDWLNSMNIGIDYKNIQNYANYVSTISTAILNSILAFAKGLTQGIMNFLLSLVFAFYILQNKSKLLKSIRELIYLYGGRKKKKTIMQEAREMDFILSGYIAAVFMDALIVCVLAIIGLKIVGHKYFLLMGVALGLLNLIPIFGALLGVALACVLGMFQGFPTALYTFIVLEVIQQLDGNIIQPKIVGDKVGLEPLWVITAVLVFGAYWGITGMLIAVPFAAFIKAILKDVLKRKKHEVKLAEEKEMEDAKGEEN